MYKGLNLMENSINRHYDTHLSPENAELHVDDALFGSINNKLDAINTCISNWGTYSSPLYSIVHGLKHNNIDKRGYFE